MQFAIKQVVVVGRAGLAMIWIGGDWNQKQYLDGAAATAPPGQAESG